MATPSFSSSTKDGRKYTTLGAPAGFGPWPFQELHEPELTQRLHLMSGAKSSLLSGLRVDSVSFQPCPSEEEQSQDRVYSGICNIEGDSSPWSLVAVFDGHAGHDCADYTLKKFPEHLRKALSKKQNGTHLASTISQAFTSFDDEITRGVLSIFPDAETLRGIPDDDLKLMINDHDTGGEIYKKIILAMRGTTALTALIDGPRKNLWVAGIGDCRAILGVKLSNGQWEARDLIPPHNGTNPREMQNVRDAHPGEPNVTARNRVLGAIAVTRGCGYEAACFQQLVENIGARLDAGKEKGTGPENNLALCALRQLLGGDNTERVSAYMTLETLHRWMDDTSIQVVVF
ncbi:hypothetical protein FRC07_009398 [Ceratobasidium sp. 392]|nr:hypothetical protein FRC07_009398 [Ceratobasidium sp. 392]